jgi:hypothetical protein
LRRFIIFDHRDQIAHFPKLARDASGPGWTPLLAPALAKAHGSGVLPGGRIGNRYCASRQIEEHLRSYVRVARQLGVLYRHNRIMPYASGLSEGRFFMTDFIALGIALPLYLGLGIMTRMLSRLETMSETLSRIEVRLKALQGYSDY